MIKGQVIGGSFSKILVRQKAGQNIEIGELLVSEGAQKIILQAYDIIYGSQIPQSDIELMAGMSLESSSNLELYEPELNNYNLVLLKNLLTIKEGKASISKSLPQFFSPVREIRTDDLAFLTKPEKSLYLGKLRSGSKELDVDVFIDGEKALAEHILVAATTGRGKSNLTKCIVWDLTDKSYCGMLVLDPHDEYYGRNSYGLKDHPAKKVVYYTPKNPPPGTKTLCINLRDIKPQHFNGCVNWSEAQTEAIYALYKKFGADWIPMTMTMNEFQGFQEGTITVVKRRISGLLNIRAHEQELLCEGVFNQHSGTTTINDICSELENGKTVIIDTSSLSGSIETLIGSIIVSEIFARYKKYKINGRIKEMPVVSVVLEEALRVLGKEVLEQGPNVFSTVAREGRKFKIGLFAITQLPSIIPRQILANMNTKIILGLEMAPERQAVIDSASQELSDYGRNIASLDKGEAIVTSNFTRFAVPIKIPLFDDLMAKTINEHVRKKFIKESFHGIVLDG
ncbi:MAG: ATP-binding protein [Candidatus Woesearchaeota archaeon]